MLRVTLQAATSSHQLTSAVSQLELANIYNYKTDCAPCHM